MFTILTNYAHKIIIVIIKVMGGNFGGNGCINGLDSGDGFMGIPL